jgi:DNA adenine methylase
MVADGPGCRTDTIGTWGMSLMRPATCKLRPPVKWHGGKAYLARRIIAHFPPHTTYVEPFAGGASVLLNKLPVGREVLGDVNAGLVHLHRTIRDRLGEFLPLVERLPYCRETFEAARVDESTDDLGRAVRTLVVHRMSRGGTGRSFAWSERLRGGQPGDLNGWETFVADLPAIAERLRAVEILERSALDVIRQYDGPDTLHYCDPPYLHSTRTHRKAYAHEMTEADHRELLGVLLGCRGHVVLSGYASALYDEALAGWERVETEIACHAGQGKRKGRRTEVLWIKAPRVRQGRMFD